MGRKIAADAAADAERRDAIRGERQVIERPAPIYRPVRRQGRSASLPEYEVEVLPAYEMDSGGDRLPGYRLHPPEVDEGRI